MDTYDVLFCDGEIHNYSKTELAELIITAREGIFQTRLVSEQVSESIFSSMNIRLEILAGISTKKSANVSSLTQRITDLQVNQYE